MKTINKRIRQLASEITNDYQGKKITLICILKGSMYFFADLSRRIDLDTRIEFMRLSSYSGEKSKGSVEIKLDLENSIKGCDVLVVEDIIDSGITISWLLKHLSLSEPNSLKFCTLLDKSEKRTVKGLNADYVDFKINDRFVIGYGLDLDEEYRNLPNIECFIDNKEELIKDKEEIQKQLIKHRKR